MAQLNIALPNINDAQLESSEERKKIISYLNQLSEQLRFVLNNLESENFTKDVQAAIDSAKEMPELFEQTIERIDERGNKHSTSIKQNSDAIILEAERASLEEGNLRAAINVNAEQIELRVIKNEIISTINQTAEAIKILASKIKLEGYTTINNNFAVDTNGNVIMRAGDNEVTVTTDGVRVTNSLYTSFFSSGGISVKKGNSVLFQVYPSGEYNCILNVNGIIYENGTALPDKYAPKTHYHSEYASYSHSHSGYATNGELSALAQRVSALESK